MNETREWVDTGTLKTAEPKSVELKSVEPKPAEPTMRTLFVSHSGLLPHLVSGKVTQADLAAGIYFFGTQPEQVLDDPPPIEDVQRDMDRYRFGYRGPWFAWISRACAKDADVSLHALYGHIKLLQEEVRRAMDEGRCAWWDRDRTSLWEQLLRLLEKNGVAVSGIMDEVDDDLLEYNYMEVERFLAGRARVVWNASRS